MKCDALIASYRALLARGTCTEEQEEEIREEIERLRELQESSHLQEDSQ